MRDRRHGPSSHSIRHRYDPRPPSGSVAAACERSVATDRRQTFTTTELATNSVLKTHPSSVISFSCRTCRRINFRLSAQYTSSQFVRPSSTPRGSHWSVVYSCRKFISLAIPLVRRRRTSQDSRKSIPYESAVTPSHPLQRAMQIHASHHRKIDLATRSGLKTRRNG